ncbi:MAG: betaine-aldehyde dehydrogenase [Actinobacteria bacterium]|nr:betaine-aldehyde dehydrogenase [Actinomycetota bacterium]|tara:strand:+ start:2753 stop:4201 length:1449 start_codon:yes stop_codon:yes gene_type:complete
MEIAGSVISLDHYIGGERVSSPSVFQVHSPLKWEEVLAEMSAGDHEISDLAVASASDAFQDWASLGPQERASFLYRLADLIDREVSNIARVECTDMAMRHESLFNRVIPRGARNFRAYADLASAYEGRTWESNGTTNLIQRLPAGPTVVITPWNAPFMLATWKIAPALAAGNTVILKPAEWAPLSSSILADLVDEAGFPPGVFNVVQGIGGEVGSFLTKDPRVRRISFTGSTETARKIGIEAAKNVVPFTAELGGKGALVVLEDADVEQAAATAAGQYDDSGQVCLAATRLIVSDKISEHFLECFHQNVDGHILGDSFDDETTITPLIHPDHLQRVESFIDRALENGDEIIRGGRRLNDQQLFYEPTLVKPASNNSEIVQREVFGPVLTFQTFQDEQEAVKLANSTEYGLSATLFTGSKEKAEIIGSALRAGTVWVNCFLVRDLTAPFGGLGISGLGREGGDYALDFHSDLKTLQIKKADES